MIKTSKENEIKNQLKEFILNSRDKIEQHNLNNIYTIPLFAKEILDSSYRRYRQLNKSEEFDEDAATLAVVRSISKSMNKISGLYNIIKSEVKSETKGTDAGNAQKKIFEIAEVVKISKEIGDIISNSDIDFSENIDISKDINNDIKNLIKEYNSNGDDFVWKYCVAQDNNNADIVKAIVKNMDNMKLPELSGEETKNYNTENNKNDEKEKNIEKDDKDNEEIDEDINDKTIEMPAVQINDVGNNNTENNTQNTQNNFSNKEHELSYDIMGYDDVNKALEELKNMVNDYNSKNPDKTISLNIVNNDIHASVELINKFKKTAMLNIKTHSRLKKLCSGESGIWQILTDLNFDKNWLAKAQNSNGITATFYEGSITKDGINYDNKYDYIIYYDSTIAANKISRLKKLAEETQQLLLPEANNYFAILSDAIGYSVDKNAKNIESACPYVKQFNDFASAEKWILNQKSNIVYRDGNGIPDDGNVWNNKNKEIYEKYYKMNDEEIPKDTKTIYNISVNLSDTPEANKLYNKWFTKYKKLFN